MAKESKGIANSVFASIVFLAIGYVVYRLFPIASDEASLFPHVIVSGLIWFMFYLLYLRWGALFLCLQIFLAGLVAVIVAGIYQSKTDFNSPYFLAAFVLCLVIFILMGKQDDLRFTDKRVRKIIDQDP
jgi:hypothetical protein